MGRTNRIPKSRGHWEVEKILTKLGYRVKNEFSINDIPYDIYVPSLNLIIEYYGDRWHYHKKKYPAGFYDHVKGQYAWQKWEKDKKKIARAKELGYYVIVIWQYDWKRLSNKRRHIEKIVKNHKELYDGYSESPCRCQKGTRNAPLNKFPSTGR